MGTVGLSFGSPTSGTGFDVSTTVAEIVGNLQNVETPWKTQLTALESQDTAISSLGTLYSNLSNDMSSLTDFEGILAEKTGSSSDTGVLQLTSASSSAVAGTHTVTVANLAQTSSGYLSEISSASETLSGSITLQVGSGTAQTITLSSSDNTLAGLAAAINSSGVGINASVLTDSSGSRLSLVSGTSGADGNIAVSENSIAGGGASLGYTSTVTGKDAQLTVDGVSLTSASNTVSNLIPGVTFQLLAPSATESDDSLEQVQVVIGNDNSDVESTVASMVSDYNALISAINAQEGKDSSGNNEPLFGSPTLSLLQQQLLGGLNVQNPSGGLDAISDNTGTTLSGSMTIAVGGGTAKTVVVGPVPSTGAALNTIYTGSGSDYDTLSGVAAAINAANADLSYSDTGYTTDGTNLDTGTVGPVGNSGDTLAGSISIQVGAGTAQTVTLDSSDNTLPGLASTINTDNIGVTASVVTNSDGTSSLSLVSQTAGTAGALTVNSGISDGMGIAANVATSDGESNLTLTSETEGKTGALAVTSKISATSDTAVSWSDATGYTNTTADSGTVGSVADSSDTLSGSMTIAVGSGQAQTFDIDSLPDQTLSGLADAITAADIGVTAAVNAAGTALTITSGAVGSDGALTVTSSLLDTSQTSTATLNYTSSSDIASLTSLGISVNNDGSLTFDANSLDSLLNTDYNSVVGFFQNADSWGQQFSTMLTNSGTSSTTGILSLAASANSSSESNLNAEISKEEVTISAEQTSLTAELNSANEIMQELPAQLQGVNELYSAITGYNQASNG